MLDKKEIGDGFSSFHSAADERGQSAFLRVTSRNFSLIVDPPLEVLNVTSIVPYKNLAPPGWEVLHAHCRILGSRYTATTGIGFANHSQ